MDLTLLSLSVKVFEFELEFFSEVVVEALLYIHRNRRFIRDGEPGMSTSTFTQLLNSVLLSLSLFYSLP